MKKLFLSMVFALFLGVSMTATADLYQPSNVDVLHFQTKWLKEELNLNKNQNLVISPLSLYQALALSGHGLNGGDLYPFLKYNDGRGVSLAPQPEKQGPLLPVDKAAFRIQLGENMLSDGQVKIANSIWGNQFLPEYMADTKTYLKADAMPLPENTSVINKWIEEKTAGKITNLLVERQTNPLDLFLVNAVYFKADWVNEFDKDNTKKMPFLTPNGPVDVDMMFDKKQVDYYEDEKVQAIRLPYQSDEKDVLSKHNMTFILPKEGVDFNEFLSSLEIQDFYLKFIEKMPVRIYLPKFKLSYTNDKMSTLLKSMGLEFLFNKGVFKGVENGASLKEVIHKSIISINEQGTEAAAVTAMSWIGGSWRDYSLERKEPYFIFKADRPFLFMVDEGLFVGVVNDPTKE